MSKGMEGMKRGVKYTPQTKSRRVDDLPEFLDENERRDGCPSKQQIRDRCEVIRAGWSDKQWAAQSVRSELRASPDLHTTRFRTRHSDARLLREFLWVEDRGPELLFGKRER